MTFLILATVLDGAYAIVAGRIVWLLRKNKTETAAKTGSGLFYLAAGAWLAAMKKS